MSTDPRGATLHCRACQQLVYAENTQAGICVRCHAAVARGQMRRADKLEEALREAIEALGWQQQEWDALSLDAPACKERCIRSGTQAFSARQRLKELLAPFRRD